MSFEQIIEGVILCYSNLIRTKAKVEMSGRDHWTTAILGPGTIVYGLKPLAATSSI